MSKTDVNFNNAQLSHQSNGIFIAIFARIIYCVSKNVPS